MRLSGTAVGRREAWIAHLPPQMSVPPTDLDPSWPMIQNMSSLKGELGETNTGNKGEYVEHNSDIVMAGNTTN
ncbi:hypothetical protein FRC0547_00597 [Corynebacterium diphtheriae]|nr:hypothetical protein FRC0515_00532 [Corynebacterium diphtheriae]CAB1032608.1 hypothetical protein FRC0547_00597 [Corynebacterium diphtheriae]